jgi:F-type H+-transporting ATPase subunit b
VLIDWFTVVAQIVNFVVLVALLKRFLYGPLIGAIDAREGGIAARLAEAEEKNKSAAESMALVEARRAELEQARERILGGAREEADKRRGEMLQKARASVQAMEARWREEMERDRGAFLDEMRGRAATEILAATRGALAGLASADLEHCAIEAFLAQLNRFDRASLQVLCAGEVSVATPDELPAATRLEIQNILGSRLGKPVQVRFERAPNMPWGIELRGGGQRIGWTPDSYLDTLQANLGAALDRGVATSIRTAA